LPLITGYRTDARPMAVLLFLSLVAVVMGGFVFGVPMNWFAYGTTWEGVPFGTDATDNKTQLLLVYILFAVLSSLGSLSRGRFGRDILSSRGLGWLGLSTFLFMLFVYLIPHSIQFSPAFTYVFCYSVIGGLVVLFLAVYALARSRVGAEIPG
jgi:hypothetical protein